MSVSALAGLIGGCEAGGAGLYPGLIAAVVASHENIAGLAAHERAGGAGSAVCRDPREDPLLVTHTAERGRRLTGGPSRFLTEAGWLGAGIAAIAA